MLLMLSSEPLGPKIGLIIERINFQISKVYFSLPKLSLQIGIGLWA